MTGHACNTGPDLNVKTLGIMGLGHAGRPMALAALYAGFTVHCVDPDPTALAGLPEHPRLHPSPVPDVLANCPTVVVCVPTPLSAEGRPDRCALGAAAGQLSEWLPEGALICLQSTVGPGDTRGFFAQTLARPDVDVAYTPERVDPGNPVWGIKNTPRVVGGLSASAGERAEKIYRQIVDEVILVDNAETAELAKLLENCYRLVNIALVNDFARLASSLGVPIGASITAAASKPFGFHSFVPSTGPGGHCVPVDPIWLLERADQLQVSMPVLQASLTSGDLIQDFVIARLQRELGGLQGRRIALIGWAYKSGVADHRNSSAIPLARRLRSAGAVVSVSDPYFPDPKLDGERLPHPESPIDAGVVITLHPEVDPRAAACNPALLIHLSEGIG